jgi:hypothetical protein
MYKAVLVHQQGGNVLQTSRKYPMKVVINVHGGVVQDVAVG